MTIAKRRALVWSSLFYLLAAAAGAAQAAPVTSLAQGQTGPIEFTSITPTTIAEFVKKQTTATVTISATLTLPAGATGKVPAMILAHHCGGITTTVTNLAAMLNGLGIATFIPDSFNSRGYAAPPGVCTGSTLNNTAAVADALYALKLLATHPNIDASRIGIIGQSYGGTAVYTTAFEEARRAVIDDSLKFAAHIGLYPTGCSSRYWSDNVTGAPILSLLGALDDWTPATPCMDFTQQMRAKGAPTTTIVYPNARHAWDGSTNLTQNANWTSLGNCYWNYRMDLLQSSRYDNGQVFTSSAAVTDYLNSCKKYGASQGGDAATKAAAETDIKSFLARVFKLSNITTPASQPDRIFNYLEAQYSAYLAPAGAASQTGNGYYFRHYPTSNSYLATDGGGKVYYYSAGTGLTDIGGETSWLSTAGQSGY